MWNKVFGSTVDWISQHSVLPEYFRQQFYDTGQFFPEFAANIGGGQNIYNFAYYGLYSPLILPSYLLPFIKMSDYIVAVSILCLIADAVLFCGWLKGNGVSKGNRILVTALFILAGPMIFHSYNQIMFVNYMPFLLLGFRGVDRYFEKKKTGLLTVSIFLMIMTSFYFSIGGILVLILYAVYKYLSVQEKSGVHVNVWMFIWDGVKFCLPIGVSVLMSSVLLVPTALALMGTRGGDSSMRLSELLLPDVEIFRVVYNPYGVGLTTLIITVLLTGLLYEKWRERYIHIACIVLIVIPLFMYLLNGGLYIRDKALIPLLPLLCFLIANYLEKQKRQEIPLKKGILPFICTVLIVRLARVQADGKDYIYLVLADSVIMLICGIIFYWKRWEKILILVPILFLTLSGTVYNIRMDRMLDRTFYDKVTSGENEKIVADILENEQGFYRLEQSGNEKENAANLNRIWSQEQYISSVYSSTYNEKYQNFRKNVFETEQPYRNILMQAGAKNPIYQRLMGVKYILSKTDVSGYEKIAEGVYANENVLPIGYVTNHVISEKQYNELEFPYNQTAFLNSAVTEEGDADSKETEQIKGQIRPVTIELQEQHIQEKQVKNMETSIDGAKDADILFLQFRVKNNRPSKDVSVWVNGVKNKLAARSHIYYNENETFTYAVPIEEGQEKVDIGFGAGDYEISNIKCYAWSEERREQEESKSDFIPDKERAKGNCIAGGVHVKEDGYFVTSIPYDENFELLVDGKEAEYERVNTAFIGFKIEEGYHEIEMTYHAPGAVQGKLISVLGLMMFVCLMIYEEKHSD